MPEKKYEQKDNTGALFNNSDKKQKESEPDYKGSAVVDGVDMWVNGWINTAKSGLKYLKLSFAAKKDQPQRETETNDDDDGEPMPF